MPFPGVCPLDPLNHWGFRMILGQYPRRVPSKRSKGNWVLRCTSNAGRMLPSSQFSTSNGYALGSLEGPTRKPRHASVLVTRPKYPPPPYRETGVAIPLSHCVSCGIADYRCYTPTSVRKSGLLQSKDSLTRGYRRKNLPLKPIAL